MRQEDKKTRKSYSHVKKLSTLNFQLFITFGSKTVGSTFNSYYDFLK